MRAVIQRVSSARVEVDGVVSGAIDGGILVLLGVAAGDGVADVTWLLDKIINLRIFPDREGKMNLSLVDSGGALLAVSQFTLLADCRKGRRPGFSRAATAELARELYQLFVDKARAAGVVTATGVFQADMQVHLVNDGPVTMLLDSNKEF